MGLRRILDDTAEYLRYVSEDEGVRQLEVSPGVVAALGAPPRSFAGDPGARLAKIAARIAVCTRCPLCRTRNKTVPGQGNPRPEVLFVGEGPGMDEDRQGLAFVGKAGQVLTRMIVRMGFTREEVFIANVVKCHPPGENSANRAPSPDEMNACLPYLHEQIAVLKPKVIVALGGTALRGLFGVEGITRHRGKWRRFADIDTMPTFHPSYLLQYGGQQAYWEVWTDLQEVLKRLGRTPPPGPAPGRA
jgi:uracil-DNA glycosylase family 4